MKMSTEPVVIRAAIAGVVAILALFGIAPPEDLMEGVMQIAVVAIPLAVGAASTRGAVYSPATHDADVAEAFTAGAES